MPTIQDFDYNIFIDGSWPDWGTSDLSNDGSRAIIASWEKSRIIDMPQRMPRDKYQRILEECGLLEIDYLVIIDSDEYIKQPFNYKQFKNEIESIEKKYEIQSFKFSMEYYDSGNLYVHEPSYRILYNPALGEYGERHNELWYKNREVFSDWSGEIKSLVLVHDKRYKTPEYVKARHEWNTNHPTH